MPPDTLPYDEDLLRHTLGLSPRVAPRRTGSKPDFYSDSEKSRLVQTLREEALKRVRITEEAALDSEKKPESDQDSTILDPLNKGPHDRLKRQNKRQDRRQPVDIELPFQEGVPCWYFATSRIKSASARIPL